MAGKVLGTKSLGGIRSSFSAIDGTWETRLTRLLCDAVVANSAVTAASYQASQKIKQQPVFTVQNAIEADFEDRESVRNHLSHTFSLPKDALWLASIGRVDPLKRFDVLVRLASTLHNAPVKAHFLLIGDGPEKKALEDLARSLGVEDRITFTGEIPSASRWMKGFDIFCFPSEDEGLPNVMLEAAAAGLPTLAWKYPFNEEILEDQTMALLIEPQNLDAMQNALLQLIASKSLRESLGRAAQGHIQTNFSLQRYIESMTEVYETMLQKP
jgi:glycosyltransferase involved in cell wall biosynthesis